jgi:hypothetical protein
MSSQPANKTTVVAGVTHSNPADGSANANPQAGQPISITPRGTVQGSVKTQAPGVSVIFGQ